MSRAPKLRDTSPVPTHDPIAPWCADVLALFSGPLEPVRFPDVDAALLEAAAETVRHAQVDTEAAERALDEARARTQQANAALADLCSRALAYARVFATNQPELDAALAELRTPIERPASELAPKKRGRPRKDSATVALLPDEAPGMVAQ